MEAFLITAIPLFSAGFISRKRTAERLNAYFAGLVMSALLFALRFFVFFSRKAHPASFLQNFLPTYVFHIALPCIFVPAVFFFFARFFRRAEKKRDVFAPLMLGFYTFFVPYNIFGAVRVFSESDLFAVPVSYIAFAFAARALILSGKKAFWALAVVFSAFPALCETVGYYSPAASLAICAVCAGSALVLQIVFHKNE